MSTRNVAGRKCEFGCVRFVCVTRPCPIVLELTPYYPDPLSSSPGSVGPDRIFQGKHFTARIGPTRGASYRVPSESVYMTESTDSIANLQILSEYDLSSTRVIKVRSGTLVKHVI